MIIAVMFCVSPIWKNTWKLWKYSWCDL